MSPIQSIVKFWKKIFMKNEPLSSSTISEPSSYKEINKEDELNQYIQELIQGEHFEQVKDFLLPEKNISAISDKTYQSLLKSYCTSLSQPQKDIKKIEHLLDILEMPHNFEKFYEMIAKSANSYNDSASNRLYEFKAITSSNSLLMTASQKLYSQEKTDKFFTYSGLKNLNDIEKRLIQFSYSQIIHGVKKAEQGLNKKRVFSLSTDFTYLSFFEEHPEYRGHPLIFENTVDPQGTIFFEKANVEYLLNDSLSKYAVASVSAITSRRKLLHDKFYDRINTYSKKPFETSRHQTFLNKINDAVGSPIENILLKTQLDQNIKDLILNKYNNLSSWKNTTSDSEILHFIQHSQDSLIHVASLCQQISGFSNTDISSQKIVDEVIQSIDVGISKHQEQSLSFLQQQSKRRVY